MRADLAAALDTVAGLTATAYPPYWKGLTVDGICGINTARSLGLTR